MAYSQEIISRARKLLDSRKADWESQQRQHQQQVYAAIPRVREIDMLLRRNMTAAAQAVFTQGGVVGAGDKLMDIVPLDQPLLVEGRLPVQNVDKVQAGQPVELEFMAFNRASTPKLPGTVKTVSADRLEDEQGMPYYHVEIAVDDLKGREVQPGLQLQPGMPVTAFVKTGERTLMSYLLKPLRDRARLALTEE